MHKQRYCDVEQLMRSEVRCSAKNLTFTQTAAVFRNKMGAGMSGSVDNTLLTFSIFEVIKLKWRDLRNFEGAVHSCH